MEGDRKRRWPGSRGAVVEPSPAAGALARWLDGQSEDGTAGVSLFFFVTGGGFRKEWRKGKEEEARAARWLPPPPAAAGQGDWGAAPCSRQRERRERERRVRERITLGFDRGDRAPVLIQLEPRMTVESRWTPQI